LLLHTVKVYPSKINLPKKKQLAWKIAEIASDNAKLNKDAIEMVKEFVSFYGKNIVNESTLVTGVKEFLIW